MRVRYLFIPVILVMLCTGAWASDPTALTSSPDQSKRVTFYNPAPQTDDAGGPPYYVPAAGWDVDGICISSQSGYPQLYHYWGQFDDTLLPLTYSPPYAAGCWWSDGNGEPVAPNGEADEWLISPSVDCTTATNLNIAFWSAYTVASYGSAATAHNYVQISTDGGNTWTVAADLCHDPAYEYPGTGNSPTFGAGWNGYEVRVNINLTAYNGEPDVRFAFNYVSTDGAAPRGVWMVDDVELRNGLTTLLSENMDGTWIVDPDYVAVTAPSDLTCSENGANVDLTWVNNDTYDNIEVYRDGVLVDTLAGTATGYTVLDELKGGHCYLVCGVSGDLSACSDICCLIFGYDDVDLLWDFEADDGGFTTEGTTGWQWGAPTYGPCHDTADGNVWATNLDGDYEDSACYELYSPVISEWGDKGGYICIDHCYDMEEGYDGGVVWFTTDDYWYYAIPPLAGWDGPFVGNVGCPFASGWNGFTGSSGGWVTDCWEITDPLLYDYGVTMLLAFASDSSGTASGWMVDNITAYRNLGGNAVIDCDYTITPLVGTAPFPTQHRITLFNLLSGGQVYTRRVAGRIRVTIANGTTFNPWRAGYTNIAPGGNYYTQFPVNIPSLATVIGSNTFRLTAMDVTPAPYNQPPYPPSGETCTKTNVVVANAP